jgi:hypothetical protein
VVLAEPARARKSRIRLPARVTAKGRRQLPLRFPKGLAALSRCAVQSGHSGFGHTRTTPNNSGSPVSLACWP